MRKLKPLFAVALFALLSSGHVEGRDHIDVLASVP